MAQFEQFEGPDVFNQEPETVAECLAKVAAETLKEQNELNNERGREDSANTQATYNALKKIYDDYKLSNPPTTSEEADLLRNSPLQYSFYKAAILAANTADATRKAATATKFKLKQVALNARNAAAEAVCRASGAPNPVPEPPVKPGSVAME